MRNMMSDSRHLRFEIHAGIEVPIVDLSSAWTGDAEARLAVARVLGEVHERYGYSYFEGHGTSEELLSKVHQQIADFFDLPAEEKMKLHISQSPYHRGFVSNGHESPLHGEHPDVKECFDIDLDLPADDPEVLAGVPFRGHNSWPEALPGYQPVMAHFYDVWRGLSERISRLIALSLDLPEDWFAVRTDKPLSRLRTNKYFPQDNPSADGPIGCGTHTDYGLMSFIWQIDNPGLQIRALSGEWFDAPIIPGALTMVLGDAAEIWTNGHLKATVHRVINTSGKQRLSVSWFDQHNYECELRPLEKFVSPTRPARYEPITMGAWKNRGFDGIFEYRKPARTNG